MAVIQLETITALLIFSTTPQPKMLYCQFHCQLAQAILLKKKNNSAHPSELNSCLILIDSCSDYSFASKCSTEN